MAAPADPDDQRWPGHQRDRHHPAEPGHPRLREVRPVRCRQEARRRPGQGEGPPQGGQRDRPEAGHRLPAVGHPGEGGRRDQERAGGRRLPGRQQAGRQVDLLQPDRQAGQRLRPDGRRLEPGLAERLLRVLPLLGRQEHRRRPQQLRPAQRPEHQQGDRGRLEDRRRRAGQQGLGRGRPPDHGAGAGGAGLQQDPQLDVRLQGRQRRLRPGQHLRRPVQAVREEVSA
ncbi:hypothetical protein SGPA1_12041 [Streptomyces misionensis JCM 4497]